MLRQSSRGRWPGLTLKLLPQRLNVRGRTGGFPGGDCRESCPSSLLWRPGCQQDPEEWPRSILVVVPCGTKVEVLGVAGFCDGLSNGRIGEIQDA